MMRNFLIVLFFALIGLGSSHGFTLSEDSIRTYLIDLGNPLYPTSGNWNNVTGQQSNGITISSLIDTTGATSTINFVIVDEADDEYGNGDGFNSNGYNGDALGYPASAVRDTYFAWSTGGQYKFNGLNPENTYNIKIFGSRMSSTAGRVGRYTINGNALNLDAWNNTTETIQFTGVTPDVIGEIYMDFIVEDGSTFGYIGVIELTEHITVSVPNAPGSLHVTSNNPSEIQLAWLDNSDNEDGFIVERNQTGSGGPFAALDSVDANIITYSDSLFASGISYDYRVMAFNSVGNSAYSNEVSIVSPNPTSELSSRKFLIDLGNPLYPTLGNWNNVTGQQSNETTISSLIDTTGAISAISFVIVDEADDGYGNGDGFNSNGYNGDALGYPATAVRDNYFAWNTGGQYKLTGLNPENTYDIKIFGSRMSSTGGRVGRYTINGESLNLDAWNNTTETVQFTGVIPDINGEIVLDFINEVGSTFGYISVFELIEHLENSFTNNIPDSQELQALTVIFSKLGGEGWSDSTNWLNGTSSSDFATWHGITVENGDVTEIDLQSNILKGEIPPEIQQLGSLRVLRLNNNQLKGEIPVQLARLENLEELYLDDNQLEGYMDLEFSVMPNIRVMALQNNNLVSIPDFSFNNSIDPLQITLNAENNKLEFYYIENNLNTDGTDILGTFTYMPQKTYGEPRILGFIEGNELVLKVNMLGRANHYQWQFSSDQGQNWTDRGADDPEYTETGIGESQEGWYRVRITNDRADEAGDEIVSAIYNVRIEKAPVVVNRPEN